MDETTKLLKRGDMRTTGESEAVVRKVLARTAWIGQVIDAIQHDDPGVRMRAADAAEKISRVAPDLLKPYKKLFLTSLASIDQKEVRWHMAQILPRFDLTGEERVAVLSLMKSYLKDNSRIVRTSAMQTLADIALQNGRYLPEVRTIIEKLMAEGSPAMKARGRKLMAKLKKTEKR